MEGTDTEEGREEAAEEDEEAETGVIPLLRTVAVVETVTGEEYNCCLETKASGDTEVGEEYTFI